MPDPKAPSEFVSEAYQLKDEAGMVDFYQKWAAEYDRKMLEDLGYISHITIAQLLSEYLTDTDAAIFDIGCGTGLTCALLAEKGYSALDGIDLSPDMVRVAGDRGIYRELIVGDVNQAIERNDDSYRGVISSGTFTHGHVGPEPLDEIFRILEPGGLLACTIHQDLWESRGFKNKLEILVGDGTVDCLKLYKDKYYENGEPEGWFCIYQKCD